MTNLTTRSNAPLSKFAFGTMQFGDKADAAASAQMFNDCINAGINHFDTATGYAEGRSEQILGGLIGDARDDLYIATKVGYMGGSNPANIDKQFHESLTRLKMDEVDLLYLHRFDDDMVMEDTFAQLATWQKAGKIRHIGVSNYAAWQVMKAQTICAELGTKIDVIQPMFNLVKRQAEVEILPMCRDQNIAAFPYSPLGGGLLTGKYGAQKAGRLADNEMYASRYGIDWMHDTAGKLLTYSQQVGVDAATLAVAWVDAHPLGPRPIISARSSAQLAPSLAAIPYDMSAEQWGEISALSRTPAPATDRSET